MATSTTPPPVSTYLIDRIHQAFKLLANQGQSRYFPPVEIDKAVNDISIALQEDLLDEYQRTQRLSDYLSPMENHADISVQGGFAEFPVDYAHATNISGLIPIVTSGTEGIQGAKTSEQNTRKFTEHEAYFARSGEWSKRIADEVVPPEAEFPVVQFNKGKIQVEPLDVATIRLYYIKKPVVAIWGFDIASDNTSYIFNEIKTTDLNWPSSSYIELMTRTAAYLGVPLKDGTLVQLDKVKG